MADSIITLDLPDLIDPAALPLLSQSIKDAFLDHTINIAQGTWIQLASERLHTSRRSYINGIQEPVVAGEVASVALVGAMPNLIERGQPAYDMHDTLLGPNVPVVPKGLGLRGKHPKKGGGYYRSIPFRHATPGTQGSVGQAMGGAYAKYFADAHKGLYDDQGASSMGKLHADGLGERVYEAASKLKVSAKPEAGGKVVWGGRLQAGLAPKLKAHHRSDIYAGMVKVAHVYEDATQDQYKTFRSISTGSPGWMAPAREGVHLVNEVRDYVSGIAERVMVNLVQKALDKTK